MILWIVQSLVTLCCAAFVADRSYMGTVSPVRGYKENFDPWSGHEIDLVRSSSKAETQGAEVVFVGKLMKCLFSSWIMTLVVYRLHIVKFERAVFGLILASNAFHDHQLVFFSLKQRFISQLAAAPQYFELVHDHLHIVLPVLIVYTIHSD